MRVARRGFWLFGISLIFVASVVSGGSVDRKVVDVLKDPAIHVEQGTPSVFLAIAAAGKRLVAVGEYGRVYLSDDSGATWRQAKSVPVRVTLTGVAFATPQKGWAVGHSGVVLSSADGGETWTLQLDGIKAAQLVLDSVSKSVKGTPDPLNRAYVSAKRLVDDGADKPFLNVYADSEENAFVIGAYNLIFRTTDGGKNWQPWQSHVENPMELHLYAMRRTGQDYYIVGEQGTLLRSSDGGNTFKKLQSPYEGSLFGMIAAKGGELVIFGLRGNAFSSLDRGRTWKKVDFNLPRSFSSGTELEGGALLLATFSGDVLVSRDRGRTFEPYLSQVPSMIADVVQGSGGGIVTVGMGGVISIGDLAKLEKTGKGGAGK